ncbi:DDE-type integrase/transposase/recombinase [Duffyella gerundensis]|nr:DDE-type integrase/transposase/recombinase [Duffyella gerundensis]QTO55377.1 DDE-type integrase/transposase/recombinase [Duffyella gerundensis]
MKEAGLESRQPRRYRYRAPNRSALLADNHVNRAFNVENPERVWCGDITFIRARNCWLYLAVVLDLFARKVVGWCFSEKADSHLTQAAMMMAWHGRGCPQEVMFHWDNAVAERLFFSLKTEWVPENGYRGAEEAKKDVMLYLKGYYNRKRPYSSNGGLSPADKKRRIK